MKETFVHYSMTPFKGVCVPFTRDPAGSAVLNDLIYWPQKGNSRPEKDVLSLRRDEKNLYISFTRYKSTPVQLLSPDPKGDLWKEGDLIELLFGAVEGNSFLLQLAVGVNGRRFDSTGEYDSWSCSTSHDEYSWSGEIAIGLEKLHVQDLSCGFDFFLCDSDTGKVICWSPVRISFHEFDNYGKLIFCDSYDQAYFALTHTPWSSPLPLTRETFERAIRDRAVPATGILHGPWVSNMEQHCVTIGFSTAGIVPAFVEYRKQGDTLWKRSTCARQNGIVDRSSKIHILHLEGLEEGTLYEYRLLTTLSPQEEDLYYSRIHSFRTFSAKTEEFSFVLCSDIHSDTGMLRKLLTLPEVKKADFLVNLGDLLSSTSGPGGYYEGFLDCECELLQGEKPVIFCRGNHEQIGIYARTYLELFPTRSGKTFYAFRHGKFCFIVLDAGNDHKDSLFFYNKEMREEEQHFLEELKKSSLYQNAEKRIAFIHIPPHDITRTEAMNSYELLKDLDLAGVFCGHLHNYLRMEQGKITFRTPVKTPPERVPFLPFPVIATDTDTAICCRISGTELHGEVFRADGTSLDTFTL